MAWFQILGWLGTFGVLGSYAYKQSRWFDWANALLFVPVALPSLILGAYSAAAISIAFGVIAIVKLCSVHAH